MSFSKIKAKNLIKGFGTTLLIGLCASLVIHFLVSKELRTTTTVSTTYKPSELSLVMNRQLPDGYVKANYKVNCSQTPSDKDLSPREAAEIIAQEIYRLSKKSLDHQTIDLTYVPLNNKTNSYWTSTITFSKNYTITVDIDGSTGELRYIDQSISQPLNTSQKSTDGTSLPLVTTFLKNKEANCAKAQKLIADSGYVTEAIASFKYSDSSVSVQYENNKAVSSYNSHIFNLTTTSGKEYKFYLSQDLNRLDEVWTPEFLDELHSMEDPVITKAN